MRECRKLRVSMAHRSASKIASRIILIMFSIVSLCGSTINITIMRIVIKRILAIKLIDKIIWKIRNKQKIKIKLK